MNLQMTGLRLASVAHAIRDGARSVPPAEAKNLATFLEDEEFQEGRLLTALHKQRERNPVLSKRKKESVLRIEGRLACEACGFDFKQVYGSLGTGFAECHHRVPLAELPGSRGTRVSDLAIVCANCHRMLHRSKPMLSVENLRDQLRLIRPEGTS
jgi:5-methylcytosine-specific restriction protein A